MIKTSQLETMVDDWIAELSIKRSERTVLQYRNSLNTLLRYLESEGIEEVDAEAVESYKKHLEAERNRYMNDPKASKIKPRPVTKSSTINIRLKAINLFFKDTGNEALTTELVEDQTSNVEENALKLQEYYRLLDTAERHGKRKIRLIMELFFKTGIRINELRAITVESLKTRMTKVESKSRVKYIFIPKGLAKKLREYCEEQNIEHGIIFHGRDENKVISSQYIRAELKDIAGRARGIELAKVHPHEFRHMFARAYQSMPGNKYYLLPALLGHSGKKGETVTASYAKVSKDSLLKEVDDLEVFTDAELKKVAQNVERNRKAISRRKKKKEENKE